MEKEQRIELKAIFGLICAIFVVAMEVPLVILLRKSFILQNGTVTLANYTHVLSNPTFLTALGHSFTVSGLEALITVILAFLLAYGMHFTALTGKVKSAISVLIILPMFLPILTYGFAVIYSLGKQGLITKILGYQIFDIYGFKGLLISYIITRCHRHLSSYLMPLNTSINISLSSRKSWGTARSERSTLRAYGL